MKKILYILLFFYSFPVFAQVESILPDAPRPAKLYNDLTKGKNFITPEQAAFLENKLVAYDDSTSNQVAIVIVESLEGYSANEYGTKLGRKWGVGGRDNNNGIVLLISTEPGNRDAYIAVGYGLEGAIPDVTAKRIVEYELIPAFKNGDFFRGLDNTVNAIIKAAAGEYTAPEGYNKRKGKGLTIAQIIIMIIVISIILGVIGGGRGGGGYASRRGWGGPFWGGGWSGGSWGGGGWSGGSSGGGFGGFGGGSFGGGGAGGKW